MELDVLYSIDRFLFANVLTNNDEAPVIIRHKMFLYDEFQLFMEENGCSQTGNFSLYFFIFNKNVS